MSAEEQNGRTETRNDVVIRLMKQGGYVLIAGGGVSELPERIRTHPQVILWDDNQQGNLQKTVPSNTRCIVYNTWISHTAAARLRNAAQKLHIPLFPMLRTREIKELLAEIVHEPVVPTTTAQEISVEPEPIVTRTPEPTTVPEMVPATMSEEPMALRKPHKGEHDEILAKELTKEKGFNVTAEAKRLLPIYKGRYKIDATWQAIAQAIYSYQKRAGDRTPKTSAPKTTAAVETTSPSSAPASLTSMDDFNEAKRMLRDARAAIDLIIDLVPKLEKELSAARKRQEKLRALLMD